jgi:hypothetical protein
MTVALRSPWARAACGALLALWLVTPARAYLKFGIADGLASRTLRWPVGQPVAYVVGDGGVPGVSAAEFEAAIARAAETWAAVPTATMRFAAAGLTSRPLADNDGVTHIAFDERPELDRTLASTSYTIDVTSAEILEVDIFFNAAFPWSTSASGTPGRFDVESIAVHELGHLAGLGHSAVGETEVIPSGGRRLLSAGATMFPIAFSPGNIDGRRLMPDDIAGLSDIYPTPDFESRAGSVSGRVLLDGVGVFGAHVTAYHLRTGALVGGFVLERSGAFVIGGLEPGPVVLRAEPLDDGDVESFFDEPGVQLNFRATFYDRVVYVPRGGNAAGIDIRVSRP